jgi:hypothetical protein
MAPPFFFLISPQRCLERWPYGPVRPRNAAGRTVPVFCPKPGGGGGGGGGCVSCNLAIYIYIECLFYK